MKNRVPIGLNMNYKLLGRTYYFDVPVSYAESIQRVGGIPLPIPGFLDKDILNDYLNRIGCLILIGGPDYPPSLYGEEPHPKTEAMENHRAESDYLLMKLAMQKRIPIIGVCAGMQLMNIFFGGKLIQHLENQELHRIETYHPVELLKSRCLSRIFSGNSVIVNSNHHQAVDSASLGKGLKAVAYASDGTIEAIEYESDHICFGVQWHPERVSPTSENALKYSDDIVASESLANHNRRFFEFILKVAEKHLADA